jgi:hypothetical protein
VSACAQSAAGAAAEITPILKADMATLRLEAQKDGKLPVTFTGRVRMSRLVLDAKQRKWSR